MGKKYIIILMQVLTSICIVSVGFASWTIVSGVKIKESGTISAEDVHYNEKYISKTSHEVFRYYDTGFLAGKGTTAEIVQTAQIKYDYMLLITNLVKDLNGKKPTIKFTLSHATIEGFAFIKNYLKSVEVLLCSVDQSTQKIVYSDLNIIADNNTYIIELTFDDSASSLAQAKDGDRLQIVYNFEVPEDGDSFNFERDIFHNISSSDFYFIHNLEVLFLESGEQNEK